MSNPLATDDQRELEETVLRVSAAPAVRAAREQARALLVADPTALSKDGAAGLDRALDQWATAAIVAVANDDPGRPRAFWAIDNTPREWFGHVFPGAAVAIDNPDNVNRTAALDGAWEYEIRGHFGAHPTAQTSFILTPAHAGQLRLGETISILTSRDIEADDDGRFTITLDRRAAGLRPNHMQMAESAQMLAIRDSHSDWRQHAARIRIVPVAGPAPRQPDPEDLLVRRAAGSLVGFVAFWLEFKNTFWKTPPFNRVVGPVGRDGGWGYQAGGRFKLDAGQALLITTVSGNAAYTGLQVSDPWTLSPDPVYATTSRNSSQVRPNPDGSCTYVISLIDPGLANWIDTAGLHEGWFMLRWQSLQTIDASTLLRDARLVDLAQLDATVPTDTPRVTLQERSAEIAMRARDYRSRYTSHR